MKLDTLPNAAARRDIVLDRLLALHPKIIDLSLDRVHRLLDALDNPHHHLPPVVHVSGTNGKGSVLAYLRAILSAAGYRVHVYTSPHLVRFNERIVLAGTTIEDEYLIELLDEAERANFDQPITFFEITTIAAMLGFARNPADILLLETGLGGRLDATNVIDRPALTALTPVSLDHQQYLGDTLTQIAAEKAGILKPGVTAVIGPQPAEVLSLIDDRAAMLGAPVSAYGRDWTVSEAGPGFRFDGSEWRLSLPSPALPGGHQIANAATAIACLEHLPAFTVPATAIRQGLSQTVWPGRLQRLDHGPLVGTLPPGWALWLDGGHNEDAARALVGTLVRWNDCPLDLVVGMIDSKDPRAFLAPFAKIARRAYAVTIPGQSAAIAADDLVRAAADCGLEAAPAATVADAVRGLVAANDTPARILICGSLYLAGAVLGENA
ncbi:MAG: bifunctional folylpolyglutamate synthase/dihydrofolate synthase [Alphaproteobacteria bacterium]|nr:bifunctional folylpolyglutamate synthase/dihydrofolate synthase [Alphaproteobacteria bacterium]